MLPPKNNLERLKILKKIKTKSIFSNSNLDKYILSSQAQSYIESDNLTNIDTLLEYKLFIGSSCPTLSGNYNKLSNFCVSGVVKINTDTFVKNRLLYREVKSYYTIFISSGEDRLEKLYFESVFKYTNDVLCDSNIRFDSNQIDYFYLPLSVIDCNNLIEIIIRNITGWNNPIKNTLANQLTPVLNYPKKSLTNQQLSWLFDVEDIDKSAYYYCMQSGFNHTVFYNSNLIKIIGANELSFINQTKISITIFEILGKNKYYTNKIDTLIQYTPLSIYNILKNPDLYKGCDDTNENIKIGITSKTKTGFFKSIDYFNNSIENTKFVKTSILNVKNNKNTLMGIYSNYLYNSQSISESIKNTIHSFSNNYMIDYYKYLLIGTELTANRICGAEEAFKIACSDEIVKQILNLINVEVSNHTESKIMSIIINNWLDVPVEKILGEVVFFKNYVNRFIFSPSSISVSRLKTLKTVNTAHSRYSNIIKGLLFLTVRQTRSAEEKINCEKIFRKSNSYDNLLQSLLLELGNESIVTEVQQWDKLKVSLYNNFGN